MNEKRERLEYINDKLATAEELLYDAEDAAREAGDASGADEINAANAGLDDVIDKYERLLAEVSA